MDPQTLFINTRTGEVRRSNQSNQQPVLSAILGTQMVLKVAFVTDDVVVALASVTSNRLVVKAPGDYEGDLLLEDGAWAAAGDGISTRYTFETLADSVTLRAAIKGKDRLVTKAQVEWVITGDAAPRRSVPFDLAIINSYAQADDDAPDIDPTPLEWLNNTLVVGPTLKKTVGVSTFTLGVNAELIVLEGDINLVAPEEEVWTDLFTLSAAANAIYELDLQLLWYSPDSSSRTVQMQGVLPADAVAYGLWARYSRSQPAAGGQFPFDVNAVVYTASGSGDQSFQNAHRFLIKTAATAGDVVVQGICTAEGMTQPLKVGSSMKVTRLA